jgi:hypothetical protein
MSATLCSLGPFRGDFSQPPFSIMRVPFEGNNGLEREKAEVEDIALYVGLGEKFMCIPVSHFNARHAARRVLAWVAEQSQRHWCLSGSRTNLEAPDVLI